MAGINLYDYQADAVKRMKNGCILCGGVGTGKSRTALAYYYILNGGKIDSKDEYVPMDDPPMDLYIITTARKRDTKEWEGELAPFLLSTNSDVNLYLNKVIVDSWNNIKKYANIQNSFFIFDEQRVVGYGEWTKTFLKITRGGNQWILLSATPGDTWMDYLPVFIANGYFKNKSDFIENHVVYKWNPHGNYRTIDRYINIGRLIRLRDSILVTMDYNRKTVPHHEDIYVEYDISAYKNVGRTRWNPFKEEPILNASELCYVWRKIVNIDISRQIALMELIEKHTKAIIFYNFDYELNILKGLDFGPKFKSAEWNGHKHQEIPNGEKWVYFVQYNAGSEGWNCIHTDTIIFYSQSYSYKQMVQAAGRIDRLNTPYTDLYFYHLKSKAPIDLAISKALKNKKKFNEGKFVKW